jgi:hypothetical protein
VYHWTGDRWTTLTLDTAYANGGRDCASDPHAIRVKNVSGSSPFVIAEDKTHTLTINTVGNGSVSKNPNQSTYHYGDAVTLTAIPAVNWMFANWSGDLTDVANPATIVMNGKKAVTATFSVTCVPITGADLYFTPTVPTVGQPVNLTAVITGGTSPFTYTWNFHSENVITTAATIQHSFPMTNTTLTYIVTLTASNACSSQAAEPRPVIVQPLRVYLPVVMRGYTNPPERRNLTTRTDSSIILPADIPR